MTIRAKLYAAIVMTALGPVITIGVAFAAFQSLSDWNAAKATPMVITGPRTVITIAA